MLKIKITKEQYERLVLTEQNRLLDTNKLLSESINENAHLLEEGPKDIFLGLAMLMGLGLSGQNLNKAQDDLNNRNIINQIENTIEDEAKLKELINVIKEKGLKDPSEMLAKNAKTIITNFNNLPEDKKGDAKLGVVAFNNLKSLSDKADKGYALKSLDIKTDTIKGEKGKHTVIVRDTVDFRMDNQNEMFISGGYELSESGIQAIKDNINTILKAGFKIKSVKIVASTDAQTVNPKGRLASFITSNDETGNKELVKRRAQSIEGVVKTLVPSDVIQAPKLLPNNGEDKVSREMFKQAAIKGNLEDVVKQGQQYRFAGLEIEVEKTEEVEDANPKPDQIVTTVRGELVKYWAPSTINKRKPNFIHGLNLFKCSTKKAKDNSIVSQCTF